jgi:hypothetical protein
MIGALAGRAIVIAATVIGVTAAATAVAEIVIGRLATANGPRAILIGLLATVAIATVATCVALVVRVRVAGSHRAGSRRRGR